MSELLNYRNHVGSVVKFKTHNPFHTIIVTGEVVAVCDQAMAATVSDIANYHSRVEQSPEFGGENATLLRPLKEMPFIIIQNEDGIRHAYGIDWIVAADYEVVTDVGNVDIRLYNVSTNNVKAVMQSLLLLGVSGKVIQG